MNVFYTQLFFVLCLSFTHDLWGKGGVKGQQGPSKARTLFSLKVRRDSCVRFSKTTEGSTKVIARVMSQVPSVYDGRL